MCRSIKHTSQLNLQTAADWGEALDAPNAVLASLLSSFGEVIAKALVRFFEKDKNPFLSTFFFFLRLRLKKMNWDCNILKMVEKHLNTVECQLYRNRDFRDFQILSQSMKDWLESLQLELWEANFI